MSDSETRPKSSDGKKGAKKKKKFHKIKACQNHKAYKTDFYGSPNLKAIYIFSRKIKFGIANFFLFFSKKKKKTCFLSLGQNFILRRHYW